METETFGDHHDDGDDDDDSVGNFRSDGQGIYRR